MMSTEIKDISTLKAEIARLRVLEAEQQTALKLRVNSPAAILATARSLFSKKAASGNTDAYGLLHPDLLKLISRLVIPFTLNKTLFRHSNFIMKALVSLVSQKAAGYVSTPAAAHLLTNVKSLFEKWLAKKNPQVYGTTQ